MKEVGENAELHEVLAGCLQVFSSWQQLAVGSTCVAAVKFNCSANARTLKEFSVRIKIAHCCSVVLLKVQKLNLDTNDDFKGADLKDAEQESSWENPINKSSI